jgi:hypothetical protein
MEKFLSVPVTSEQNQLIPANGVALVEQASTTTVTITYVDGIILTLTHATAGAGVETERDYIQESILKALKLRVRNLTYQCDALPFDVSGIAATHIVVATS